jgi:hypothetical protein
MVIMKVCVFFETSKYSKILTIKENNIFMMKIKIKNVNENPEILVVNLVINS